MSEGMKICDAEYVRMHGRISSSREMFERVDRRFEDAAERLGFRIEV